MDKKKKGLKEAINLWDVDIPPRTCYEKLLQNLKQRGWQIDD